MRNLTIVISSFLLLLIITSFSNQAEKTFSLTVNVEKLRNSEGIVQFVLYNKEGSIPDENFKKCYKIVKANIVNGSSTITFHGIPSGKYAVNILHDENNNGIIDKGFILPKEGIGFSNFQTIGMTNKPTFSKASFNLNSAMNIKINIIYM
ncbi:MAG TPA: DUF2141 domain-containing protein [Bacteroidales bacterium]|nr:DUF2141 domain-containing protein [Bacteroidales bacterium]